MENLLPISYILQKLKTYPFPWISGILLTDTYFGGYRIQLMLPSKGFIQNYLQISLGNIRNIDFKLTLKVLFEDIL